jgi:hypothetical protein
LGLLARARSKSSLHPQRFQLTFRTDAKISLSALTKAVAAALPPPSGEREREAGLEQPGGGG